ncbi:hypothetical protein HDU92_001486 [Lobulomyces angularis]|nr:hypothetical protein HDU92_001486 [Lobulomyces angularis]
MFTKGISLSILRNIDNIFAKFDIKIPGYTSEKLSLRLNRKEVIRLEDIYLRNSTKDGVKLSNFDIFNVGEEQLLNLEFIKKKDDLPKKKIVLFLHGGSYVFGNSAIYRTFLCKLLSYLPSTEVCFVEYRLAPEYPFPSALNDALAAYIYLTETKSSLFIEESEEQKKTIYSPEDVIIMGDSAGGGLSVALLSVLINYCKVDGNLLFKPPAKAVLMSPWLDLSGKSSSWTRNAKTCFLPQTVSDLTSKVIYSEDSPQHPSLMYIFGSHKYNKICSYTELEKRLEHLKVLVDHPLISPINSKFNNFPKTLLQVGGGEALLDDSMEFAKKYNSANRGNLLKLEVFENMFHDFQLFFWLEQSDKAFKSIKNFLEN